MTEIEQLIADLEAAKKGSPGFSEAVVLALTEWERKFKPAEWHSEQGIPLWRNLSLGLHEWGHWFDRRPDPSRNIIHVLAMMPEGYSWDVSSNGSARIWEKYKTPIISDNGKVFWGMGKTPELALCVALVKERRSRD